MKFFDILKKIDLVLIALISLLGIIVASYTVYNIIRSHIVRPPRQQVTITKDDTPTPKQVDKTHFMLCVKDCYIFSITNNTIPSNAISPLGLQKDSAVLNSARSFGMRQDDSIINLIFIRGKEEHTLLKHPALIYQTYFPRDDERENEFDKNIYSIIETDSNGDGVLNSDDKVTLLVTDYDGKNEIKLSSDLLTYRRQKNLLIFSENNDEGQQYYSFNSKDNVVTPLLTTKSATKKEIDGLY